MPDCKWMKDEICVNADCPMVADYCPVADVEGVCRFEKRESGKTASTLGEAEVKAGLEGVVKLLCREYEKAKQSPVVRDPLAYALYQTWKAVDERRRD